MPEDFSSANSTLIGVSCPGMTATSQYLSVKPSQPPVLSKFFVPDLAIP